MELLNLFLSFFKTGAFSFGGGYAMIPLLQSELVDKFAWVSAAEFTDIVTISQMTPGPSAINAATFVGYRVGGVLGGAVATLGVVMPSFIIMSVIYMLVRKYQNSNDLNGVIDGVKPIVIALIISAGVSTAIPVGFDIRAILIGVLVFFLVYIKKMDSILSLILAGVLGVVLF